MKTSPLMLALTLALAAIWPSVALGGDTVQIERFALIIGANDGGADRVELQYATTDARAIDKVLGELGGVAPSHRMLVLDPDIDALEVAFAQMEARLQQAAGGPRLELIVYYSGHSDERGLLLGGERFGYKALRDRIDALSADVRIAILDSCASGALTRLKGGQRQPSFLLDAGSEVKGHAILTSSSADEAAQESDSLGASFFTHYLISGLRGAADTTGDGRVTLNEAYQFAFHETLARTESTRSGAQHPAYDIQLSGTGDLVLTDLRATSARLVVDEQVQGRLFIRNADGDLVVELLKQPGRVVELGLAPGNYGVTVESDGELRAGMIALKDGRMATLHPADLAVVKAEVNRERGGGVGMGGVDDTLDDYTHVPFSISILPAFSFPLASDKKEITHVGISLAMGMTDRLEGTQISSGINWLLEGGRGAQIAAGLNVSQGDFSGAQVAGGANVTRGDLRLGQIAGGFNYTHGQVYGWQASGGFNFAASGISGTQVAGGFNYAHEESRGTQVAGGFNYAGSVKGLQIAPLNFAGDVKGSQFGVINIGGDVKGSQVGIINVANSIEGAPIGLFNFVREGQLHLDVWASDILSINTGVRFGSKYVYTIVFAGADPGILDTATDTDANFSWMGGLGIGGHIPFDPFFVDIDVLSGQLRTNEHLNVTNSLTRLRFSAGWQLMEHLSVFGGMAVNFFIADQKDREVFDIGPNAGARPTEESTGLIFLDQKTGREPEEGFSGTTLAIWPGFFLGVQF